MSTEDPYGTQRQTVPLVGNSHVQRHVLETATLEVAPSAHPHDVALQEFHATNGNQEALAAARGELGPAAQDMARTGPQSDDGFLPHNDEFGPFQEWLTDGTLEDLQFPREGGADELVSGLTLDEASSAFANDLPGPDDHVPDPGNGRLPIEFCESPMPDAQGVPSPEADFSEVAVLKSELEVRKLMATSWTDPLVTASDSEQALASINQLPLCDRAELLENLGTDQMDLLLGSLPADQYAELQKAFDASGNAQQKLAIWEKLHTGRANEELAPHDDSEFSGADRELRNDRRADTLASTQGEIAREARLLREGPIQPGKTVLDHKPNDFTAEDVQRLDERKRLELQLESKYDVKLSNDPGNLRTDKGRPVTDRRTWTAEELSELDAALEGVPLEDQQRVSEFYRARTRKKKTNRGWTSEPRTAADTEKNVEPESGSNIDVYDRTFSGRGRIGNVSTPGETVPHEIGHAVHNDLPEVYQEFVEISGWKTYNEAELRDALKSEGRGGEEVDAKIEALNASRKEAAADRQPLVDADRSFQPDNYRDDLFTSVDAGAVPEGPAWDYARSHPKEHFAEIYTKAINAPGTLYSDMVEKPAQELTVAGENQAKARRQLAQLEARNASADHLQKAKADLAQRDAELHEARETEGQRKAQWELFRSKVFGSDDSDIQDLVAKPGQEAVVEEYKRRAKRCATPLQLDALRKEFSSTLE